jgi:hypothetical protein
VAPAISQPVPLGSTVGLLEIVSPKLAGPVVARAQIRRTILKTRIVAEEI